MKIIKSLNNIAFSRWYWLVYLTGSLFLLADALFYQYILEELPCVICIQIRLWISLLVFIALFGLFGRANWLVNVLAQLSVALIAIGLVERSYQLLGIERGFVFGDCSFDLGLPAWFSIDQWLPWLYKVETSCGYTPEIIFKITMAEALIVMTVSLLIISLGILLATVYQKLTSD